jgi:hypothetical protein
VVIGTLPQIFGERRTGVEDHLQTGEEVFREFGVFLQMRQDRGVSRGHIEISRRRNLGDVLHRDLGETGRGLAAVDIHGAREPLREVEAEAAAEGMIPRQPVAQHERVFFEKRPAGNDLLLIGGQHAVRGDDRLRQIGRAGREQKLRDRIFRDRGDGFCECGGGRGLRELIEQRHV